MAGIFFFWDDSWNGFATIKEECQDENLKRFLCERQGVKVRDYMCEEDGPFGKEWAWKD